MWVADAESNSSWLGGYALDSASLLLPDETLHPGGMVPYLVHYQAGVDVTANLDPVSGDADLYVWYPHNHLGPDQKSINADTAADSVNFTTPHAGMYLFLVHGYTEATYTLSITPGGGHQITTLATTSDDDDAQAAITGDSLAAQSKTELTSEPILVWSGLDPMGSSVAPSAEAPSSIYLPLIFK